MSLLQLQVSHIRNISQATLDFDPHINLFQGENGSGKTSLLEAIFLLSHGRSFRTHKAAPLIQYQQEYSCVRGMVEDSEQQQFMCAVQRHRRGDVQIKLGNEDIHSIARMAKLLPTLVVNADSFQLLDAGPKYRRQFLDWGVFHVEHSFYDAWKNLQRVLRQRNAALRAKLSGSEVRAWDDELIQLSEIIHQQRNRYIESLLPEFFLLLQQMYPIDGLRVNYYPGWDQSTTFPSALWNCLERDRDLTYTSIGPQRADVIIQLEGHAAEAVLSRGQQKLVIYALRLAQGKVLRKMTKQSLLYLLDDLPAELDHQRQCYVVRVLQDLQAQVFITGVDLLDLWKTIASDKRCSMFHVEHGAFVKENSSF